MGEVKPGIAKAIAEAVKHFSTPEAQREFERDQLRVEMVIEELRKSSRVRWQDLMEPTTI